MNENDQEGVNGADLGLSMSEDSLQKNESQLDGLRKGDHIMFDGALQALGDHAHLHHLHTWKVTKTEGQMKGIDVKVSEQGRYKLSNMPQIGSSSD